MLKNCEEVRSSVVVLVDYSLLRYVCGYVCVECIFDCFFVAARNVCLFFGFFFMR